jgi:hypothetical protein
LESTQQIVDPFSLRDEHDQHDQLLVAHLVHDAECAFLDALENGTFWRTRELFCSCRPRVSGQRLDRVFDALAYFFCGMALTAFCALRLVVTVYTRTT